MDLFVQIIHFFVKNVKFLNNYGVQIVQLVNNNIKLQKLYCYKGIDEFFKLKNITIN